MQVNRGLPIKQDCRLLFVNNDNLIKKFLKKDLILSEIWYIIIEQSTGCSADGSVLGSGPRGRGFKSRHSDH